MVSTRVTLGQAVETTPLHRGRRERSDLSRRLVSQNGVARLRPRAVCPESAYGVIDFVVKGHQVLKVGRDDLRELLLA